MATNKEGYIKVKDNIQIFYKYILTDNPKGSVFIVHGLGEHSGRYENVINTLKGYNLFLLDLRGHGRSQGKRGHVMDFDEYLDDVDALKNEVKQFVRGKSFILGHSMGGLIVLRYAIYKPDGLSGVVSSGPLLGVNVEVPKVKAILGKVIARVIPSLSMNNEIDTNKLSHDKASVEAYNNDPFVHTKISARWYVEMVKAMQDTNSNAHKLNLPCLIMHGSEDALTNPKSSREFFEKASSKDKTYKLYDGFYHEIFNEIDKQKPLSDMLEWINKRA